MSKEDITKNLDKIDEAVEELREKVEPKKVKTRGDPIVRLEE